MVFTCSFNKIKIVKSISDKILLIIPSYLPIIGGAELAVYNIAKSLKSKGIKADVLTFNIKKERWKTSLRTEIQYIDGVKVYYLGAFNLLFFLNNKYKSLLIRILGVQLIPSIRLYKIIKNYDLLHFNDEVNLSLPFFLMPIKKKKIFHIRTLVQLYDGFKRYAISRFVLRNVSEKYIIETNEYVSLLESLGISKNRMLFWKKGVNTNTFKKKEIIKNGEYFNILTIGRFSDKNKGFDIILEALGKISLKIKLTIISPLFEENDYSLKLQEKIAILNKNGSIKVELIINVPQEELVDYYSKADIFVFTPRKDSMPNVLLEAASCQLPIISTNVGGIPNIINNMNAGILISPGNIEQLRNEITILLKDKNLIKDIGYNARKNIMKNYSMKSAIDKLIDIYKNL